MPRRDEPGGAIFARRPARYRSAARLAPARARGRRRRRRVPPVGRRSRRPTPSNTSAASPRRIAPTRCSSARKALCLEEMTGRPVPEGALFYGETRRRVAVRFDDELRRLTEDAAVGVARRSSRPAARRPPNMTDASAAPARCSIFAGRRPARARRRFGASGRCGPRSTIARGETGRVKKLLNTLYVTTEGAGLRKDGENLVAEVDGAERARVPLHMLGSVVVFGAIYVSPPLIQACAGAGITIVLLDRVGRFQARIEGPVSGNVLLRREQYRASEAPDEIVRSIVSGKIANQRTVLQRALRDHGAEIAADRREAIEAAVARLGMILQRVGLSERRSGHSARRRRRGRPHLFRRVQRPDPRRRTPTSSSAGARAVRRSIRSMRSCRSSTRS